MKFNWFAFLRLTTISLVIGLLLQGAGYSILVQVCVGFALGFFYPEPVLIPKQKKQK